MYYPGNIWLNVIQLCNEIVTACQLKEPKGCLECLYCCVQCVYVNVVNSWQLLFFVDYRLNPELQKKCRLDIPKFCKNVLHTQKNDDELQGKVVTCLRKRFIEKVGNSTDVKEQRFVKIHVCRYKGMLSIFVSAMF